jgi:hypothetical protein
VRAARWHWQCGVSSLLVGLLQWSSVFARSGKAVLPRVAVHTTALSHTATGEGYSFDLPSLGRQGGERGGCAVE